MKIRHTFIPIMTAAILFMSGCGDKEDSGDSWHTCSECTLASWIGNFSGKATYYDAIVANEEKDLDINVTFQETGTDYLTVSINVPNYFSATISGELTSSYSISFAGSGTSVFGTLYARNGEGNEFRFSGNAKKFHFKGDELVVDEVVTFDVYK